MQLIKRSVLTSRDVYEFCCASNYPKHWNNNSLFISTEDFTLLEPYLNIVFQNYHYYGPQKVTVCEWEKVKNLYLSSQNKEPSIANFFNEIDNWVVTENQLFDYFWILGV